ncbi:hypothetical protein HJFPF1_11195 [Paramyrothecium foliicola]|nr:hypothetical protein HJFPF1_11195 [Paramyrothecium foliicola]
MAPLNHNNEATPSKTWNVNEDVATPITRMKSKQREPPPSLFMHPSPAASIVSLPGILAPGAPVPGASSLGRDRSVPEGHGSLRPGSSRAQQDPQRPTRTLQHANSTRSTDRTDALWAEMQATLEDVQLSATGGTHVFGPEHERKLADLRSAQIALAQAWARSEADDALGTSLRETATSAAGDELRNMKGSSAEAARSGTGDGTDGARSTTAGASNARPGSSGDVDRLGAQLEEETESDILSARKRREANDVYFQRVNNGVIDVVAKLEEVALAMRAVEQESKELWNENGSVLGSTRN